MIKKLAILLAFTLGVTFAAAATAHAAATQPAAKSATQQPYSHGLLWRVERPGAPPSHVFGTIHVSDPRVTALAPAVKQSFDTAPNFMMEVLLDPANIIALAGRMLYLDGRDLPSVAGRELYEKVVAIAPNIGLPPQILGRFKPWAVALMLMMPSKDAENILDNRLYQMALQQKKGVYQLETVDEQVDVFETLPERDQVALLRSAVANHERLNAQVQRVIAVYLKGDLAELSRLSDEDSGDDAEMKRISTSLMRRLIDDRNVRMAERADAQIKSGPAFVAVGALHLYGERGVLAHLASRGYKVSRVY